MYYMQNEFENMHEDLIKDIAVLISDYEIITSNSIIIDEEFVDINMLGESQLNDTTTTITSIINDDMIFFDMMLYIEKIIKSYKFDLKKINHQFDVDFHRTELIINNSNIKEIANAIKSFQKYSKYEFKICNQQFKLDMIMKMLCTQASFAFSYLLMHKLYGNQQKGIYVTSKSHKYEVTNNNESIIISLNATFNLKDIKREKNIKQINVNTVIDFVYKNYSYELCKYGIISWNCQDIH